MIHLPTIPMLQKSHLILLIIICVLSVGFVKRTLIPFKPTFNDHFKKGIVSNILPADKKVVLQNGEEVPYDDLIIATGTGGPFPVKLEFESMAESITKYDDMCDKVGQTKYILYGNYDIIKI